MIKKCNGCGVVLQSDCETRIGYIKKDIFEKALLCERCFKLKNYGQYTMIEEKKEVEKIIYDLDKNNKDVVFLIDVLNLTKESFEFLKYFNKPVNILISKKDVLPKSVSDAKIIKYFKDNFNISSEVMCISSYKKYNVDKFVKFLEKKGLKEVYLIGMTNSGKSTLINAILASVGKNPVVTTSNIPNTTNDYVMIKINDKLTIVDTPGFILENSIYNYLKPDELKKLCPKKEIKVKTFQIKEGYSIIVEDFLRIDYLKGKNNSFSFYMNSNLKYLKVKNENSRLKILPKRCFDIQSASDVVINGLGFIKIVNECKIEVYTLDEKMISVRKKMI